MHSTSRRLAGLGLLLALAATTALAAPQSPSESADPTCDELIVDGGFEAGGQGWAQSSAGGYGLVSDFNPFAGVWGAYLGGVDNADDRLSQPVALPAGASSITLQAWWSIATSESGGAFDWMALSLLRQDGTLLAELWRVDDSADPDVWDQLVVDLAAYAGQELTLQWRARTDGSNPTDFFVDDVSIVACITSPTPTLTATASTPTPTATASTPTPTATASTPTPTATATATAPPPGVRRAYLPLALAKGD